MYGERAQLILRNGVGTTVKISLPFQTNEDRPAYEEDSDNPGG